MFYGANIESGKGFGIVVATVAVAVIVVSYLQQGIAKLTTK